VTGKSQVKFEVLLEMHLNHLTTSEIPIFLQIPNLYHVRSHIKSEFFHKNECVNRFPVESGNIDI